MSLDDERSVHFSDEVRAIEQAAREDERRRIAADLHDDLGQLLTLIKLDAVRLERVAATPLTDESLDALKERIAVLLDDADRALDTLRDVVHDMRELSVRGCRLSELLQAEVERFAERTGIKAHSQLALASSNTELPTMTVVRLLREALTNVVRHADATTVTVRGREEAHMLVLEVEDNGKGIRLERRPGDRAGFDGMEARVRGVGGKLQVTGRPGEGTLLEFFLPLPGSARRRESGGSEAGDEQ